MKARALASILSLPKAQRWSVLAEGLLHLQEHVGVLHEDTSSLIAAGKPRSAAIVDAVAAEEAAKILMILDLARLGWRDQRAAKRLIDQFSQHVPRGIYVEVAEARIATYPELRRFVHGLRVSHYLDGPNDVDWIFRNRIESRREEIFYVDFVVDEDGERWVTPQTGTEFVPIWAPSGVTTLTSAFGRMGLYSEDALAMIAEVWSGARLDDGTVWGEVADLNARVVDQALERGWSDREGSKRDRHIIVDQWPLPLFDLDLRRKPVTIEELESKRQKRIASIERDFYGADDGW